MNTHNENGNQDASTLETVEEVIETTDEAEESNTELIAKLEKAEQLASNYKIRAEKAEKKTSKTKVETEAPKNSDISQLDTFALIKADVHVDDIKEVADYATHKGISITEALGTNVVKTILSDSTETRKVAAATHTGSAKRSTVGLSDTALIANAEAGKLPDNDADLIRFIRARKGLKN